MNKEQYYNHCKYIYDNLTKKELNILSGSSCGPSNNKFLAFIVPDFFKKPCKIHDVDYFIGGTEQMRKWSDRKFYYGCKKGFWMFRPFAGIFYKSVRKMGASSWEFRKKPLTLKETKKLITSI